MFWHDRESVGVRMERAVLLSDIEFLDGVHESDWERIEEESFLVNVSKPLNENQQVVLEWLKVQGKRRPIMTIADFADAYYGLEGAPTVPLEILSSYEQLSDSETYQVLAAFAEWGMKEVAE